jgi:hypothetical protein
MSTPLGQTILKFGREPRQDFNGHCQPLDWQPIDVSFPGAFPASAAIRVFVTANDVNVSSEPDNVPVVGTVQDVTPNGFRLWGRNPNQCQRASAGFNWIAVAETPGEEHGSESDIRLGVVQPRHVGGACSVASPFAFPTVWPVTYAGTRLIGSADAPPVVVASACNHHAWAGTIDPINVNAVEVDYERIVPLVGVIQRPLPDGFRLKSLNSGPFRGNGGFYHVAVARRGQFTPPNLLVETGALGAKRFEAAGDDGDWQVWEAEFVTPFLTPPVVLVTVNDRLADGSTIPDRGPSVGRAVAAVGIVFNVTTHGFTLMARNSDCGAGFAGFSWGAFGCVRFCA